MDLPMLEGKTPISLTELARILCRSHVMVHGRLPTVGRVTFALAMIALENAHGNAIYYYNLGNIAWVGQTPNWWTPPNPDAEGSPGRFAAFSGWFAGAGAYWKLAMRRGKKAMWKADAEDYAGAAAAMVDGGWCAPRELCLKHYGSIPKMAAQYQETVKSVCPKLPRSYGTAGAAIAATLFALAAGAAWYFRRR